MPKPLSSKLKSTGGIFFLLFFLCVVAGAILPFFGHPVLGPAHPPGYVRAYFAAYRLPFSMFVQPWAAHWTNEILFAACGFFLVWLAIAIIANQAARNGN